MSVVFLQRTEVEAFTKTPDLATFQAMVKGASVNGDTTHTIPIYTSQLEQLAGSGSAPASGSGSGSGSGSAPGSAPGSGSGTSSAIDEDVVRLEGYCPLVNGRNACYMNAVLQMIYSMSDFRQFFTNLDISKVTPDWFVLINTITKTDTLPLTYKNQYSTIVKALATLFKTFQNKAGKLVDTDTLMINGQSS